MAKHCIRQWLQFGVLDLLLLTTIVAVGAVVWRPAQPQVNKAPPWIIGTWRGDDPTAIGLSPDGCYFRHPTDSDTAWGFRWTMTPLSGVHDAYVLECGKLRLVIRSEWGSGVIEVLNEDGGVKSRLEQFGRWERSWRDGMPDGTWKLFDLSHSEESLVGLLEYRRGEPVDLHGNDGKRSLGPLNTLRNARGLPALTDRDFSEGTRMEHPHG